MVAVSHLAVSSAQLMRLNLVVTRLRCLRCLLLVTLSPGTRESCWFRNLGRDNVIKQECRITDTTLRGRGVGS